MPPVKCAPSNSYVPPPMGAVARGWHFIQPGTGVWKKKYLKSVLQGFFHGFLPKVERVRREVKLFIYISFRLFFRLGIFHFIDEGCFFIQFLAGVWVDGLVVGCLGGAHGQRGLQGHGSLQVTGIKYFEFTFSFLPFVTLIIQNREITSGQAARLTGGKFSGSGTGWWKFSGSCNVRGEPGAQTSKALLQCGECKSVIMFTSQKTSQLHLQPINKVV